MAATSTTIKSPSTSTVPEPVRDLLDPWPAREIDWQSVGPDWVLFTYAVPDALDDPRADFDVTLMLLSPTDQTYEVGMLPGLHGAFGSQYEGPGVLYEINPLGGSRPLTPTSLPSSWNSPGVSNVQIIGAPSLP